MQQHQESILIFWFFNGQVPCFINACVLCRSGQSAWMVSQVNQVVNGRPTLSFNMSYTHTPDTTESSVYVINWHWGSKHSGKLQLSKSDGILAIPARRWIKVRYWLTIDKNCATLGLDENFPLFSFSNACTHGLLSVGIWVWCVNWIIYGLKYFIAAAIPKALISHGSHFTWYFLSSALKSQLPGVSLYVKHLAKEFILARVGYVVYVVISLLNVVGK